MAVVLDIERGSGYSITISGAVKSYNTSETMTESAMFPARSDPEKMTV